MKKFFLVKKNGPKKPRVFYITTDSYNFYWVQTLSYSQTITLLPGPGPGPSRCLADKGAQDMHNGSSKDTDGAVLRKCHRLPQNLLESS